MPQRRHRMIGFVSVALAALLATSASAADNGLSVRTKKAAFDDVRFDLTNAITNKGLVVDFNGKIATMLERTGADVGSAKPVYKNAEYFTFCSAKLSRQMMEADAANIGLCPYAVFIYETAAAPGTTQVGYRRMPAQGAGASNAAFGAINALLDEIVAEATK